jgi:ABC-type amino acid transport substrate-binding protein
MLEQTFTVVSGTTSEKVLTERIGTFQLKAKVVPVKDYAAGVQAVFERKANVFFGDRPILLEAAKSRGELVVIDRRFTDEQIALALKRGDEDFRLVVDRVLSRLYGSPEFRAEYAKWFGQPDERAAAFFRSVAQPE